VSIGMVCVL